MRVDQTLINGIVFKSYAALTADLRTTFEMLLLIWIVVLGLKITQEAGISWGRIITSLLWAVFALTLFNSWFLFKAWIYDPYMEITNGLALTLTKAVINDPASTP